MPRELSPFELDRELSRVAPRARAAYRLLNEGQDVTLSVPDVLLDPETIERLGSQPADPLTLPLLRWLHWLQLSQRALPLAGERMRRYRRDRHALDAPISGQFTWRELLGRALRDAARRPALLDALLQRGSQLSDAQLRLYELRAQLPQLAGHDRAQLELPCAEAGAQADAFLLESADAYQSLEVAALHDHIELGLAHAADDGWPRSLSLRSLAEVLGERAWFSGLRLDCGTLPAALSAASFARGLMRLGAAWIEALAPASQPFAVARDPFGLARATQGALFAGLVSSPAFLKRQLGLGRERASRHARALAGSALAFTRTLALRVLLAEPALRGAASLREAFGEQGTRALGFEPPPEAAGLLWRPRTGDAQRLAGCLLGALRNEELVAEYDEDWYRNPRAIERLRSEAALPPAVTCGAEELARGVQALTLAFKRKL